MKSPESTMADVRGALKSSQLNLEHLRELKRLVENQLREAEYDERYRLAFCDPQEMMPGNWGMYGVYEADFVSHKILDDVAFAKAKEDHKEAKAALDKVGCRVVRAIRREDMNQIKLAVAAVRILQKTHREFGACDTEGRHALQDVLERACNGTAFDFEGLWAQV